MFYAPIKTSGTGTCGFATVWHCKNCLLSEVAAPRRYGVLTCAHPCVGTTWHCANVSNDYRSGIMSYSGGFKEEYDLNDDEEEAEDGEGGEMKTVNDHCILLIDARPNMFEPINDDGDVRKENRNTEKTDRETR